MSQIPNDRYYTATHEWAWPDEDQPGEVVVGITDHAQHLLGDMVFIETPEVDMELAVGDNCGVLESVKAASDLYSPISGTVIDVNERLVNEPELINNDPYGEGWIFRLRIEDEDQLDDLMDASEYEEHLAGSEDDSHDDDDDDQDDDDDDDDDRDDDDLDDE